MTRTEENLIEIAWVDYYLMSHNCYRDDVDSIDRKQKIIDLAHDFEDEYEGIDWNESDEDYYEVIDEFANEKLYEEFGRHKEGDSYDF